MIALDPTQSCKFFFDPATAPNGPCLLIRFLTVRELRRYAEIIGRRSDTQTPQQDEADLHELLKLSVIGWQNVRDREGHTLTFDVTDVPGSMECVCTGMELWKLAFAIPDHISLQESDRKKSASARASDTAGSMPSVTPPTPEAVASVVTTLQASQCDAPNAAAETSLAHAAA